MHDHAPYDLPPATTDLHPAVARLTAEFRYPRLDSDAGVAAFLDRPGVHCLLIPGDARRNLETADAAVILPELRQAFQGAFDCAVIDDAIEAEVRERYRALKTPGLLFFRQSAFLGSVERVRDWSDYLARITHFLSLQAA
jgi:hydrogenase-1 operon protein HyaE